MEMCNVFSVTSEMMYPSAQVGAQCKASGSPREPVLPCLSARLVSLPGMTSASPDCCWG